MVINNCHPEEVSIIIDGATHRLAAHSSNEIVTLGSCAKCQIIHNSSITSWSDTFSDNILNEVSKMTAIIVDSEYSISEINCNSQLDITNEIASYEKDNVCVIYHGVICKNAKIELVNCYSNNINKLVGARKLLFFFDANDFPIISPIIAMVRYNRLKKIASWHNLWQLLLNKTTWH